MYIGVDYYPEHWPRSRWETDARLMQKAGFNVVRLAEFAWVFMEPVEGRFKFAWLDDALAVLARRGIAAILGTPTAVMPAWLARQHPECLAQRKDGQRIPWGVRKNNCFTAPAYHAASQRITRAMAGHFAKTPNVIGWQTDNEFGGPMCYCDTCRAGFADWLKRRYRTLAALNAAWGTHFWGQIYQQWEEIPIPDDPGGSNPSALLDWQRCHSRLNVQFQHEQVAILRALCPRHFITHNFMGFASDLDYYDLAKDLDHVSWDNYPVWQGDPRMAVAYDAAAGADLMRGLKRKNIWIMEQTGGPSGWGAMARNVRPGELRKIVFQELAHGADHILWFRWRTCTAGREQYWHGLLGHDGRPLRRYREAAATARDCRAIAKALAGTAPVAEVAMIYDYDSIWATRFQPAFTGNDYHAGLRRYYTALFEAGVTVDMIPPGTDAATLRGYKAIVAPELYVLPDAVAKKLAAYVKAGGVLLADLRLGVKDETSLCHARTLPGLLSDALGITIEEYEGLDDVEYAVFGRGDLAGQCTGTKWADWLTAKGAEVLAGYAPRHMHPFAAATRNRFGKGWGYYVGTVLKEPAFYRLLIADVLKHAGVQPVATPPAGVEMAVRRGKGRALLFVLNHTEEKKTVPVLAGKRELLSGKKTRGELTLGAFGVAVVRM